jgi:hypothetical protein
MKKEFFITTAIHPIPLYLQKLALKFADQWWSSVGVVRLQTESHGVYLFTILASPFTLNHLKESRFHMLFQKLMLQCCSLQLKGRIYIQMCHHPTD